MIALGPAGQHLESPGLTQGLESWTTPRLLRPAGYYLVSAYWPSRSVPRPPRAVNGISPPCTRWHYTSQWLHWPGHSWHSMRTS